MEAILLCGLQASGKSTFYKARFADTHVRINLDMLRTRRREALLLDACLAAGARFVIDNTNPTRDDRRRYIAPALAAGFSVAGYYFRATVPEVLRRNAARSDKAPIPEAGVRGTASRLQVPSPDEGFHRLWAVAVDEAAGFAVTPLDAAISPDRSGRG